MFPTPTVKSTNSSSGASSHSGNIKTYNKLPSAYANDKRFKSPHYTYFHPHIAFPHTIPPSSSTPVAMSCRLPKPNYKSRKPIIVSAQNGDLFFGSKPYAYKTAEYKNAEHPNNAKNKKMNSASAEFDSITTFDVSQFKQMCGKSQSKSRILHEFSNYSADDGFSSPSTSYNNSPESTGEFRSGGHHRANEFGIREFLERYSLPRVVKVAQDGRPILLYKFLDEYVTATARGVLHCGRNREKIDASVLYFPEMYQGWFSMLNDKGQQTAVVYTSILQLVQEQVYTFYSKTSISGYVVKQDSNDINNRLQYVKCTIDGNNVFKLRAVFQHSERANEDIDNVKSSKSRREKDLANRYAQIIDEKHQEVFVPLTTKGQFFEVSTSTKPKLIMPGDDMEKEEVRNSLYVNKECIYRLNFLLKRCALPLRLKMIDGTLPATLQKGFTDVFLFEKKLSESVLISCQLPTNNEEIHRIKYMNYECPIKLTKTLLGYDNEHKLFNSTVLQTALTFCRQHGETECARIRTDPDWSAFQHKLRVYNENKLVTSVAVIARHDNDKPKPWFKRLLSTNSFNGTTGEKIRSLDRYKDMSKLIEEKFGRKPSNPVKKSASFMFTSRRELENISLVENQQKTNLIKSFSVDRNGLSNGTDDIDEAVDVSEQNGRRSRDGSRDRSIVTDNEWFSLDDKYQSSDANQSYRSSVSNAFETSSCERKPQTNHINLSRTYSDDQHFESFEKKLLRSYSNDVKRKAPDLLQTNQFKSHSNGNINETLGGSFITDKLCSEFHVKTKNVTKTKKDLLQMKRKTRVNDVVIKVQSRALPVIDDLPYSNAVDALNVAKGDAVKVGRARNRGAGSTDSESENIYAEIYENEGSRKIKLGANETESRDNYVELAKEQVADSEAIYNTLR